MSCAIYSFCWTPFESVMADLAPGSGSDGCLRLTGCDRDSTVPQWVWGAPGKLREMSDLAQSGLMNVTRMSTRKILACGP